MNDTTSKTVLAALALAIALKGCGGDSVDPPDPPPITDDVQTVTHDAFVAYAGLFATDGASQVIADLQAGKITTQQQYWDAMDKALNNARAQAFAAKWDVLQNEAVGVDKDGKSRWDVNRAIKFMQDSKSGAEAVR